MMGVYKDDGSGELTGWLPTLCSRCKAPLPVGRKYAYCNDCAKVYREEHLKESRASRRVSTKRWLMRKAGIDPGPPHFYSTEKRCINCNKVLADGYRPRRCYRCWVENERLAQRNYRIRKKEREEAEANKDNTPGS